MTTSSSSAVEMTDDDRHECTRDLERIGTILSCGILEPSNIRHPLRESAFIELVICLRDLLFKAEKYGKRIDFTDDVVQSKYVKDVTDAVVAVRDACCHVNSFKQRFDECGNRGAFNVVNGKGTLIELGDIKIKGDYEDDIAVYYGSNRLYLRRHVVRATEEARKVLEPHLSRRR